ncbi:MAG: hypothetical protein AAGC57_10280 [Pseudomonadota bacterium]
MPPLWVYAALAAQAAAQFPNWDGACAMVLLRILSFPLAALMLGLLRWPGPVIFIGLLGIKGVCLFTYYLSLKDRQDVLRSAIILLFGLIEIVLLVLGALAIRAPGSFRRP